MTAPGSPPPDVVGTEPRGRGPWGGVALVAVVALVIAGVVDARRPDRDASPAPSAPVAPTASRTATRLPAAPTLSAPPVERAIAVTAVGDRVLSVRTRVLLDVGPDHRITSYVALPDGFAAVVTEEPVQSASPAALHVGHRGDVRRIAVDDGARVFAGLRAGEFWTESSSAELATRRNARGDVIGRVELTGGWNAVAETTQGLVMTVEPVMIGLQRPGRQIEELPYGSFVAADAHRVLYRDCPQVCRLAVTDLRTGQTWRTPAVHPEAQFPRAALSPRGDAVAFVTSIHGAFGVYVVRKDGPLERVTVTPTGTEARGTYAVDWVDDGRLAVFEVRETTNAFVYDLATRTLGSAGRVDVPNANVVLADPA